MTKEPEDLPFDLEAVKAAFKNVKHMNDLTKDGGPFQLIFKSTLERLMSKSSKHPVYHQNKFVVTVPYKFSFLQANVF